MMRWSSNFLSTLAILAQCFLTTSAFCSSSSIETARTRNNHEQQNTFSPSRATAAAIDMDTSTNSKVGKTQDVIESSAFEILAQKAIHTLLKSDSDTDENEHAYGSASQGLWINSKAAGEFQSVLDRIVLQVSCVVNDCYLIVFVVELVCCVEILM